MREDLFIYFVTSSNTEMARLCCPAISLARSAITTGVLEFGGAPVC